MLLVGFLVLAHWNDNLQVNMLLYLDMLYWLQANQYFLLLFSAVCLVELQLVGGFLRVLHQ